MHTIKFFKKHPSKMLLLVGGMLIVMLLAGSGLYYAKTGSAASKTTSQTTVAGTNTDDHWRKILSADQYKVLRQAATEAPFTGALVHETRPGTYFSVGCDKPVFRSEQKYDSGTGWPSFFAPIKADALVLRRESNPLDGRTEVLDTCGSHLGHVFDDGPPPTGQRYCMNSVALYFVPDHQ